MDKILLSDIKKIGTLLEGLRLTESNVETEDAETVPESKPKTTEINRDDQCLTCNYVFLTRDNQVDHYKSDWHRYNLKLRLHGALPVTEKEFDDIIDEISSISGSESEIDDSSDTDEEERTKLDKAIGKITQIKKTPSTDDVPVISKKENKRSQKLFFTNSENQKISVNKCILSKTCVENDFNVDIAEVISCLQNPAKCCIILLNSGHFAAAVFEHGEVKIHKTFHRYVQRAKQGSVQSVRDSAGNAPKSGGASLRRYNEMALATDIQTLLNLWKNEHLTTCSHIFLRTPHHNKTTFYNGKNAPLDRKDPRIKGIPLPTRRPTFNELKRVYKELFSIEIHKSNGIASQEKRKYRTPNKSDTAQENEKVDKNVDESAASDKVETKSPNLRNKKQKRNKTNKGRDSPEPTIVLGVEPVIENASETEKLSDELFTVCKTGDVEGMKAILASIKCGTNTIELDDIVESYLNQPMGKDCNTLLHIAAKAGHRTIVWCLLESGANPAIKNKLSQVPYSVSSDKAMRNTFRKFMSEYPEKFDYKTSLIPEPLTEDMEKERNQKLNQKKKAQKALRKERMKIQKAEKEKKELEEQEKDRFASLSDREKRAIAAERRLAKQLAENSNLMQPSVKRCWLCGESLLGKIPFEYFDYQFCSMQCLKKHKASVNVNK